MEHSSNDTIIALSSGGLPSGVAVIRTSGPLVQKLLDVSIGELPKTRMGVLREIRDIQDLSVLDKGIVFWFPGPASYTGEDCAEFHVHGGKAVVDAILSSFLKIDGVRLAVAGEFSRRAFENGKLDLTEVDGIADLVSSETEAQRKLALHQSQGSLRSLYEDWRSRLVYIRAMVEAEFDFSDEEDVPEEISVEGMTALKALEMEIASHLRTANGGEIVKEGFKVALVGSPNSGKSSLLNALARRDVAIVTAEAGTTRDVLEVALDIAGYKVVVSDTAGIRETTNVVELEGIKRAKAKALESDLVLWLVDCAENNKPAENLTGNSVQVWTKTDLHPEMRFEGLSVSSITGQGLGDLIEFISSEVRQSVPDIELGLVTRRRYRTELEAALLHICKCLDGELVAREIRAEELRLASDCLGRITGKIDVEDLLDVIFSEFCVGK